MGNERQTGDELASILAALSNPHRLRIVATLARGSVHVSQLARDVGLSRPLVHMHLQRLEAAGLVTGRLELSYDGKSIKFFEVTPFAIELTPGSIVYAAAPDIFDDGPAKPIRIWSRLGRRPLIAAGNSNGDIPMLEFAGTAQRPPLRLLVQHDDAAREADYVKGAEQALERAGAEGWTVISMKDDWATVFAPPAG